MDMTDKGRPEREIRDGSQSDTEARIEHLRKTLLQGMEKVESICDEKLRPVLLPPDDGPRNDSEAVESPADKMTPLDDKLARLEATLRTELERLYAILDRVRL